MCASTPSIDNSRAFYHIKRGGILCKTTSSRHTQTDDAHTDSLTPIVTASAAA